MRTILNILIGLIFSVPLVARADQSTDHLETYLTEVITSAKIGGGSALLKASRYWLSQTRNSHFSVVRFIKLHDPASWSLGKIKRAGDYMAINVAFNTCCWDQPWITSFELIRQGDEWSISDFDDITRRPIVKEPDDAEDLLSKWLEQAFQGIARLDQAANETKSKAIRDYYESGLGFWTSSFKSKMWFLWLNQHRPTPPTQIEIEDEQDNATNLKAHFFDGRLHQPTASFRFSMKKEGSKWFIANYEDIAQKQRKEQRAESVQKFIEQVGAVGIDQGSAESVVDTQLAILSAAERIVNQHAVMTEVINSSEPLWVVNKEARRSLGRLVAMNLAEQRPGGKWLLDVQSSAADKAVIVATPVSNSLLFKGIRFELTQKSTKWMIQSAILFR